jgi:hypothetical protein
MNLYNLATSATADGTGDLNAAVAPFQPNNTVLALSAAGATLEESDDNSTYSDLVALTAGVLAKVTLEKQYVRIKSGGTQAQLIGN